MGNADGSYDFDTLEDFAAGNPAPTVILFGSLEDPDFVVSQQILGAWVQDSWSPNRRLQPAARGPTERAERWPPVAGTRLGGA